MDTIKLANGHSIPALGLGTYKSPSGQVGKAVEHAVSRAGYRHIDCAVIYKNEPEIGKALTKILSSSVTREKLFITSKLWNTHHHPGDVKKGCTKTLGDLNLEYLDLYLMHWGMAFPIKTYPSKKGGDGLVIRQRVSIQETWKAMEQLVERGLVRSIGAANFTAMMIFDLLSYAQIRPVVNQIELHPYNTQEDLIQYCKKEKIVVTAYSPLGTPGIASDSSPKLLDDATLKKVASKHDKTTAQVLLKWGLQRGTVVIPKSVKASRIDENIEVFDFKLSTKEMNIISELNRNHRYINPSQWWGIPYFS